MSENIQRRTGTVDDFTRADGSIYYRVRVRCKDGKRRRDPKIIPPSHAATEKLREIYARAVQAREDEKGTIQKHYERIAKARTVVVVPKGALSLDDYRKKLAEKLEAEGRTSMQRPKSLWNARVSPHLGKRPIASITRDEVEDFRDKLDLEVKKRIAHGKEEGLSGKSAMNIWSLLASTMKEAVSSRDREMRVRTENPCFGVKPPLSSPDRAKTFIWPNEFASLMSCADIDVPRAWKEAYAVVAYLYLRPGEARALTFRDLDLTSSVAHITRAWDSETGKAKAPKTARGVRDVPIEPALLPLLKALHGRRSSDDALVCPILAEEHEDFRASTFREHLAKAKVTRSRLLEDTATTQMVNFRSLRDSGITWLFLKDPPTPIERAQRRAGHETISTTLGYAKAVEDLTGHFGQAFGWLPFAMPAGGSGGSTLGQVAAVKLETSEKEAWNECEGRELNPYRNNPART